jgi:DNA-binding LacI/PurR family transcriptional regulator
MLSLDKNNPVALYAQLASQLREQIHRGELPLGSKLPTEIELARRYSISRGTARQAMAILTHKGLVKRVAGKGTFVRRRNEEPVRKCIGLVIPHAQDSLSMEILVGAESVAKSRGYSILFCYTDDDLATENQDIERLRNEHVGGLIICPVSNLNRDDAVWQLHQENFPFVLVDRYFPGLDADYVVVDNAGGAYAATAHLAGLGYRSIGFASTSGMETTSTRDRFQGYRRALEDKGLPYRDEWVCACTLASLNEEEGQEFIRECWQSHERPQAYFAVNDLTAMRMMRAAAAVGLSLPRELALVGFDDIDAAARLSFPLTTVAQPRREIGVQAAGLLLDRLEGTRTGPTRIVLPVSLVVRESCGAGLAAGERR